jgi:hypothetical protein
VEVVVEPSVEVIVLLDATNVVLVLTPVPVMEGAVRVGTVMVVFDRLVGAMMAVLVLFVSKVVVEVAVGAVTLGEMPPMTVAELVRLVALAAEVAEQLETVSVTVTSDVVITTGTVDHQYTECYNK